MGRIRTSILLGGVLCAVLTLGCRTASDSAPKRLVTVELHGNTPGQIADVAIQVFRAHGYKAYMKNFNYLVFEKKASRLDDLAYGDWVEDQPMWLRVKAHIVPAGDERFHFQCDAFLVRNKGEALEEELRVKYRKGPYEKLLKEVAQRLALPSDAQTAK